MCMYTLNLSFNKKSVSFYVNFKQFFSVLSLCFLSEGDFPKFKIFLISIFFLIWSKVGDHEIFNFSQIIRGRGNSRIFGTFPHFAKPDIAKRGNTHSVRDENRGGRKQRGEQTLRGGGRTFRGQCTQ